MRKFAKAFHPKRSSMRYMVWSYFLLFTVLILILIWFFQYFFLNNYYKAKKVKNVERCANKIVNSYNTEKLEETIRMLAFDNNLCVVITDEHGNYEAIENNLGAYSFMAMDIKDNHSMEIYKILTEAKRSEKGYVTKMSKNTKFHRQEIIYCRKIFKDKSPKQAYLYIESSVEPIDSTVRIIREQLVYITIVILELAFLISMFISRRLSQPITKLTQTAIKFKDGNFDVTFDSRGYHEIEELAGVLEDAKNEVRKVSDLRKDLIANISHDLRTPLTMVKAYAEMIRDLSGDNPQKRNEHIQIIIDEADRLSNLVNSLLELSKLESGNIDLNITEFSITEKIEDCMTRYSLMIEQNGYDIKFIADEDRKICADSDKLDQVIYNFINNAINYTGDKKIIRIKQINLEHSVRIEVTDNGKGISAELLPKVFDRYYRDAKVKRDIAGTGLGLSICKEILKKHNFAFGVLSEENKGSTFWFETPVSNGHNVKTEA